MVLHDWRTRTILSNALLRLMAKLSLRVSRKKHDERLTLVVRWTSLSSENGRGDREMGSNPTAPLKFFASGDFVVEVFTAGFRRFF